MLPRRVTSLLRHRTVFGRGGPYLFTIIAEFSEILIEEFIVYNIHMCQKNRRYNGYKHKSPAQPSRIIRLTLLGPSEQPPSVASHHAW